MIKLSINLSKIPKDKITTSKSGDKWINLVVWENKEPDKYGYTHSVTMNKKDKEEKTVYVGTGKDGKSESKQDQSNLADLPF